MNTAKENYFNIKTWKAQCVLNFPVNYLHVFPKISLVPNHTTNWDLCLQWHDQWGPLFTITRPMGTSVYNHTTNGDFCLQSHDQWGPLFIITRPMASVYLDSWIEWFSMLPFSFSIQREIIIKSSHMSWQTIHKHYIYTSHVY